MSRRGIPPVRPWRVRFFFRANDGTLRRLVAYVEAVNKDFAIYNATRLVPGMILARLAKVTASPVVVRS